MQQGDQYALPLRIVSDDGTLITPDNCTDVKIRVGDFPERTYRMGEIPFYDKCWRYPLTQEQTLAYCKPVVMVQAQVLFDDGTVIGTPVKGVKIGQSIIRTEWE